MLYCLKFYSSPSASEINAALLKHDIKDEEIINIENSMIENRCRIWYRRKECKGGVLMPEESKPVHCKLCNDEGTITDDGGHYMRMPTSEWCSCPIGQKKYAEFIERERILPKND